jgi:hypothetical protein
LRPGYKIQTRFCRNIQKRINIIFPGGIKSYFSLFKEWLDKRAFYSSQNEKYFDQNDEIQTDLEVFFHLLKIISKFNNFILLNINKI